MFRSAPHHPRILGFAFMLWGFGLSACSTEVTPQLVQGECRPVHGSDVCVWGETTAGALTAFGATVPIGALENAPADEPMAWPPVAAATIPLPEAVTRATGIQVLTVYWEAHGHPPGAFLTPHFDFHFNVVSAADLQAIDCADTTKPSEIPAGYDLPDMEIPELGMLLGLCVPSMGMHALRSAELTDTALFHSTMVVGYYAGQPLFIEPMIARATLLERRNFTIDVPEVPNRPASIRYPTAFRADYDSTAQAYRFVFSGVPTSGTP